MKQWQTRLLWLICGVTLIVALIVELTPSTNAMDQLLGIPEGGANFTSQATPLTAQERELLGEAFAVKKIVLPQGGAPFLYSAIDGSLNRHAVHDPRYCFIGAGWRIVSEQSLTTGQGEVQSLTLERDGEQRRAMYWFSTPEGWFVSPMNYWAKATWRRLTFGAGGEEPILIVVQSLGDQSLDDPATLTILEALDPWKS
ncbi:exosortase-associated EpsI family protein [Cerasicoccus frondis]|uniref:exosortase-associated EpsI family protein n=1 Tax=Cerasicoccus frondis TaxID=490090 RepID=UPI0028528EF6|nr:exosortase-associated EpsI family protein [Cerasicoccus frondis]